MTFSETELSTIQRDVQVYVGRMKAIARQHAKNRYEILFSILIDFLCQILGTRFECFSVKCQASS